VRADAVDGPSTPASSLFQKKAENTTPTIQAVIRQARRDADLHAAGVELGDARGARYRDDQESIV